MSSIGSIQVGYRGPGPWGGMTTQSRMATFQHELLENCYVSSGGHEIRPVPGFRTYLDFEGEGAHDPQGVAAGTFYANHIDARRPVSATTGGYDHYDGVTTQTMRVWCKPTHVHGFAQVSGKWVLFGETDFRREPIFDAATGAFECWVTGYAFTGVSSATLTLDKAYATGSAFNQLDTSIPGTDPFRLMITGLTGLGAATLNDVVLTVTGYPSATTISVTFTGTGGNAANNDTGEVGSIGRVSIKNDSGGPSSSLTDDRESLTTWTTQPTTLASTPGQAMTTAHVANRHRDFSDSTGATYEGSALNASRRRQLSVPYRLVPHVAGNRLIMVAPGYSCVFQAPYMIPLDYEYLGTGVSSTFGVNWIGNDLYDKPRCVGVPKAVMYVDNVTTTGAESANINTSATAALAFGGSSHTDRSGVYKFAVSYKDEATGESGLLSEVVTITTGSAAVAREGINLYVLFPGYIMPECLATSINVYRTKRNGESLYFDRTVPVTAEFAMAPSGVSSKYGIARSLSAGGVVLHLVCIQLPYTSDENLEKHVGNIPVIEQMPMGVKAARTVRGGWTVYGGALGNAGVNMELIKSSLAWYYDKNFLIAPHATPLYPDHDVVFSRIAESTGVGLNTGHERWGAGVRGIPPAYAGQEIFSRTLFPAPRQTVRLDKLINNVADYDSGLAAPDGPAPESQMRELRYKLVESPLLSEVDGTRDPKTAFMKLPRGQIHISEADNPGVVPSTNTTIVSKEVSEDIEGIGEANGQLVVCTRSKTYYIGYGQSPVGVPGELANDQFGCIGANTMVSFDMGCAWISDRGPCAIIGGSFSWIGEAIQHLFTGSSARYLRDSTGMMRHAWAANDSERGLLYFGLYANRDPEYTITYQGFSQKWQDNPADASDEARSRWPCDEVLIYNYRVGAWSVWRPPLQLLIKWMASGTDKDGVPRMFFLGDDNRVYAMDDNYAQWNESAIVAEVQADVTSSTTLEIDVALDSSITGRGTAGTYWNAGMEVLVVSQAEGTPLIKATTLVSYAASVITLADAVTATAGDKVYIGVRSYTIQTNYINVKPIETSRTARAGCRFSLDGGYDSDSTVSQPAFAQVKIATSRQVSSANTPITVLYTKGETGYDDYVTLASDGGDGRVMDRSFALGGVQGVNARMEMRVSGGAGVRLHDLYLDAQ